MKARSTLFTLLALRPTYALAAAALLAGCSTSSSSASPADGKTRDAARIARVSPSGAVRQVSWRSPYGDVAATGNLALDGDFELESEDTAWFFLNADYSFAASTFSSGGQCRSGLFCAQASAGQILFNQYVSIQPGASGTMTFAAQPSGPCTDVTAQLLLTLDGEGLVYDEFDAQPTSTAPGPDGWCTYTTSFAANRPLYQDIEVLITSASDALVDDVVVAEAPQARAAAEGRRRDGDPAVGRKFAAAKRAAIAAREKRAASIVGSRTSAGPRALVHRAP